MEIERFTTPDGLVRYRLLAGEQSDYDRAITDLSPKRMKTIYEYVLLHLHDIEVERYNEAMDERNHLIVKNREKPWLPFVDGE